MFCKQNSLIVDIFHEPLVLLDSFHSALNITFPSYFNQPYCNHSQEFFYFKKSDFLSICSYISQFDWHNTLIKHDADYAMNLLYDVLHRSIIDFVQKCIYRESIYPIWFSKDLRNTIILKKQAHFIYKSHPSIPINNFHFYVQNSNLNTKSYIDNI